MDSGGDCKVLCTPYNAILTYFLNYYTPAMVVKMPRIVGTNAGPITIPMSEVNLPMLE